MRGQDSVEVRRERGEIACKECRRLKLKCDKNIPCSSCLKRGCAELCPNSAQITVHGPKGASVQVERLHAKVLSMSKRIRELEEALATSHVTSTSVEPHPLLVLSAFEEEITGLDEADSSNGSNLTKTRGKENEILLDRSIMESFKKLVIVDNGSSADSVLEASEEPEHSVVTCSTGTSHSEYTETGMPNSLPCEVRQLCGLFPLGYHHGSRHQLQDMIYSLLPSYERAIVLVETYIGNLSWIFKPIDKEQIMEELILAAYCGNINYQVGSSTIPTRMDPHDLALLFAVLAIGAASDFIQPPYNEEGETYRYCCLATLSLKSIFDHTTLACVQALSIIATYETYACRSSTPSGSYKMTNLSCTLAIQLGLHRESSYTKLSEKIAQRRRMTFWDLYAADCRDSFVSGRPTIFKSSSVDCAFPDNYLSLGSGNGVYAHIFWVWRTHFVRNVVFEIVEKLHSEWNLKYSEVLALDQRVRAFHPFNHPEQLAPVINSAIAEGSIIWYIHRYAAAIMKGLALALLHRNFFARAILERPDNPEKSVFAPSFFAAYYSAVGVLRVVREHYDRDNVSSLLMRIWPVWSELLADTLVIGSVAALGSRSPLAREAFLEFDMSIGLFAKAQMHPVAKDGLPVLLRLRDRAFRVLTNNGANAAGIFEPSVHRDYINTVPVQLQTGDFNVVNALGRVYWMGRKGVFGPPFISAQKLITGYSEPPTDNGSIGASSGTHF